MQDFVIFGGADLGMVSRLVALSIKDLSKAQKAVSRALIGYRDGVNRTVLDSALSVHIGNRYNLYYPGVLEGFERQRHIDSNRIGHVVYLVTHRDGRPGYASPFSLLPIRKTRPTAIDTERTLEWANTSGFKMVNRKTNPLYDFHLAGIISYLADAEYVSPENGLWVEIVRKFIQRRQIQWVSAKTVLFNQRGRKNQFIWERLSESVKDSIRDIVAAKRITIKSTSSGRVSDVYLDAMKDLVDRLGA